MHRVQIVGHGEAEVKIYPIRRKADRYRFFQIAWYELGQRRTKTLVDPLKAKSFAQQVHVSLLNQGRAVDVTPQDIQMFRDAEAITAKFGVSLPFAIREWADTREILRGTPMLAQAKSLADALKDVTAINAQVAAKEYIRLKEKSGLSSRHIQTVRRLLDGFGRNFPDQMLHDLSVKDLQRFIDGINGAPRTKNNLITCLKTFFLWAQKQSYVRQDRQTAANALDKKREAYLSPEIFTPEEMHLILTKSEPNMVPYMAIGAFAGLRSAEIGRLDWSAIDFESGYIKVSGEITKTQQRRLIPILPNLRAWLLPFKKDSGPVTFFTFRKAIRRCAKAAGVPWKSNALRHSFGSYRLAEVQDAAKVSLEMGNSPAMLFKHYRELVTPEQARQWFAIMPAA
jgi:integrase